MNVCLKCEHTHAADDVWAVGRFTTVVGYKARGGKVYASREDAQESLCRSRQDEAGA